MTLNFNPSTKLWFWTVLLRHVAATVLLLVGLQPPERFSPWVPQGLLVVVPVLALLVVGHYYYLMVVFCRSCLLLLLVVVAFLCRIRYVFFGGCWLLACWCDVDLLDLAWRMAHSLTCQNIPFFLCFSSLFCYNLIC